MDTFKTLKLKIGSII